MSTTGGKETPSPISAGIVCNVYLEEFTSFFDGLSLADPCPGCSVIGVRHPRREIGASGVGHVSSSGGSKNILSPTAMAFMKLGSQFPEWSKNVECRQFLKRIELVLQTNAGIPEAEWKRVFLYTVKEQAAAEWVMENIINENLDWTESKKVFTAHFQKAEYSSLLMKKFHSCKQFTNESVQAYSDRFTEICSEMERKDEDLLVLDHYIRNLNSDIRKKFEDFLSLKRVEQNDVSYQISSLEQLVKICIIFDVARITVNPTSSSSNSNWKSSSDHTERKQNHSHGHVKPKYCSFHKTNTHNTNECRHANENKSSTPSSANSSSSKPSSFKPGDKSNVRCYKCGSIGHYSNECTKPASTSNSSGSGSSTSQIKRPNNPPDRLTYTQLGQQGQKTDVAGKSVVMNSGIPTGKAGRVWLYDPVKNRHFGTLVDTGADVSFIDSALAKELGITINPAGPGNVTLAHADITTPREGVTGDFNLTAILSFSESEIAVKPIAHKFELMKLDTSQYSFVIGADLLPFLFPISIPVGFDCKQKSEDGVLVVQVFVVLVLQSSNS